MNSNKDLLTTREASEYLGLSKSYLYQLVFNQKITHYKSQGGKITYFKRDDLDAWALCHRVTSRAEATAKAEAYCQTHKRA